MAKTKSPELQASLFEDNYLQRTYGSIVRDADTALTELVANAWDAGAASVNLVIPDQRGETLSLEDDGTGMTPEQFAQRWMTLAYDRIRHQSETVEFPPERANWPKRRAYGRNGIGRHGLFCFDDSYFVETWVGGAGVRYGVEASSGTAPFKVTEQEPFRRPSHGTLLRCRVHRNLPSVDRIREVLGARFLFDPQFELRINGARVALSSIEGVKAVAELDLGDGRSVSIKSVDSVDSNRTTHLHGVVFWADHRRIGEPSWVVNGQVLLDGRRSIAKRVTFVVTLKGFEALVQPDWSGFIPDPAVSRMLERVAAEVAKAVDELQLEQSSGMRSQVLESQATRINELPPVARSDVKAFVDEVISKQPNIAPEALEVSVSALVHLEETKSGRELLMKLQKLSAEDVEGLNKILDEWTVRDAKNVLDEIGRRAAVVEALEKLVREKSVDELATIHPLVTQARWLFGPEYEAASYVSNGTIRTVIEKLFGKSEPPATFVNHRKRPDLVFRPDSTFSVLALQKFSLDEPHLPEVDRVLIVELKRGGFKIGRDEVEQACRYVEDILTTKDLGGRPTVSAFVVGYERDRRAMLRKVGEDDRGRIQPTTFNQLIEVANLRLFDLRTKISDRFDGDSVDKVVTAVQDRLL